MRKTQNVLAAIVVIGAIGVLLFQGSIEEWWKRRTFNKNDHRPRLGMVESVDGSAKIRAEESMNSIELKPGMNLHPNDTILTEENQRVTLAFNSGLKVELEPHSTIVITDSGAEMVFLKGHVKVLNEVPGITLPAQALTKEEAKGPEAMPQVDKSETPSTVGSDSKPHGPLVPNRQVDPKKSLPDSYISSVIKNQKTFLTRCYAQHLQNDPDTQGRIDTSIIIESDGSVSTARIVGSTIADPQLQQCIVSTLQRAKFKSFAGNPIVVNYPITFD